MINLRKIAVTSALLLSTAITAEAQIAKPKVVLGFNTIYSMPFGSFKNDFKFGAGGEVYGGIGLDKTFAIVTIGYRLFGIEDNPLECTHIKVGVKQFFLLKKVFLQGDLGIVSVKYGGAAHASFSPDIGAGVRLGKLELGLSYDTFKWGELNTNANNLNAKIGFNFYL